MSADKYRRDMGTLGVAFIVMNGLIGAGIFGLPEVLHQAVGNFAPWLILAGAFLFSSVVYCFAALSSLTDRSGGPQRFVTDAFGNFPGFQIGWLFYSSRMLSYAANVSVLMAYATALWPVLGEGIPRSLAIIVIFGMITALNVIGTKRVVAVLGVMTFFKLLPLVVLIGVAIIAGPGANSVSLPQFSAVEGVALAAIYAFTGSENATIPAGEANDPKRAMPRALLAGFAIVTLVYFGLQYAYSSSAVAGTGADAPLAALAGYYGGAAGSLLIAATAIVSVLANSIAGHTTASRMTASLSDDRLIPGWFGRVSRWGTPANSIVVFGLGGLIFALSGTFVTLAVVATLARLIVYASSISALPRMRIMHGLRPLTVPIGIAAATALSLCTWAIFQSSREQWALIAAFLLVGTVLFFVARRDRAAPLIAA